MKTTMKAAILLLSGTIFFSQASLAGKGGGTDCPFPADSDSQYEEITTKLRGISMLLAETYNDDLFTSRKNAENNYFGLRCKVAFSENKMEQEKLEDAATKLLDSAMKVQNLGAQSKLEAGAANALYKEFFEAWELVYAEANK